MVEEEDIWGATDAPMDGYASEGELDTQKLVAKQNRKNKKSGGFQVMGLSQNVYRGIIKKGYKVPTPIQRKTIPVILERRDVVAMARTGSGKTACFLIPLFERLKMHMAKAGARALILTPTRELALQTLKFTRDLGKFTGLRAAVILGGDSMEGQFAAIHENPDIIIATPGRFVHICVEMELRLTNIEYVVYDEADRLFEMGFSEQLHEITARLPDSRQTLLFSATLPKMLVEFARAGLVDPVLIRLDVESKLSENLRTTFCKVNSEDKLAVLLYLLRCIIKHSEQTVIFAATKHHVEYLHMVLEKAGISSTYTYSALDPAARKINVAKFQSKKVRCMVVTDVAARGIDIPLLDNVINYNFPAKAKLFVHRVGRVARAGRCGVAYSLVAPDESPYLLDLHLFLSQTIRYAPQEVKEEEKGDWNRLYGRVPQTLIDSEMDQIQHWHETSSDLNDMKQTTVKAYKQYVKSRPAASSESIRRMKEEPLEQLMGFHPLFFTETSKQEEERNSMLEALKKVRPKSTIFEVTKLGKTQATHNMQKKRELDGKYIEAFNKKMAEKFETKKNEAEDKIEALEHVSSLEQSTEDEISQTFNSVVGNNQTRKKEIQKRKLVEDAEDATVTKKLKKDEQKQSKKKKTKSKPVTIDFKEKGFYIPSTAKDQFTEAGYSVGTSFEKEAASATLDLIQDDDDMLRKQNSLVKWDRKKKKFAGEEQKARKIKTESGVWIQASYKSDRYQRWMNSTKQQTRGYGEDSEETSNRNQGAKGFQTLRNKSYGKKHPLLKMKENWKGKKPPKRELKTQDEILKKRRKDFENKLRSHSKVKREKGRGGGGGRGGSRGRGGGGGRGGGKGGGRGRGR